VAPFWRGARGTAAGAGRRGRPGVEGRVQQSRAADARAARSRGGSREPVLLPRIAAPERVRSLEPGRVGDAGAMADLLRVGPGISAAARLRHRRGGRLALPPREYPAERLATRRGVSKG